MTGAWSLRFPKQAATVFTNESGMFMREFPTLQDYEVQRNALTMPGVDGRQFLTDTFGGPTYAITFGVQGVDELDTRRLEGKLKALWRGDSIRNTPDAVAELIADTGRSSFGRPGRIATSDTRYDHHPSQADLSAEWDAADALWYGAQSSADVGLVPKLTRGLSAPLRAPLTVAGGHDSRSTEFTVDTDVATWPWAIIRGPIATPGLTIIRPSGRRIVYQFATTLAYDDAILIDTAPWSRGVIRQNSGGAVPVGAGSSRLASASLTSGTYELVLTGTAPTGNPRATVYWRDAHTTP